MKQAPEIGARFGQLTFVKETYGRRPNGQSVRQAIVICDCSPGIEVLKELSALVRIPPKGLISCGCLQAKGGGRPREYKFELGQMFGLLTVVGLEAKSSCGKRALVMQCSCGSRAKTIDASSLTSGLTKSCGCHNSEVASAHLTKRFALHGNEHLVTHGLTRSGSRHQSYGRWRNMMDRCYNASNNEYHNYGGRGIKVFDKWHDVVTYCSWLDENLGSCPDGHSLDRFPNNDGNYEPGNVRWADAKTQANNRRLTNSGYKDIKLSERFNWFEILTEKNSGSIQIDKQIP